MSTDEWEIHIVSKSNHRSNRCVIVSDFASAPLAPSSIRVRTNLIGLTANNISYASNGTILHWWDTYPVPDCIPAPFNDRTSYGIVPAWGYAVVLESTTSIAVETVLWGYFPMSSLPTDLEVVPAKTPGHWIDTSEHRKRLMAIYQRYMVVEPEQLGDKANALESMAWTAVFRPLWESAYILNRFVLAATESNMQVHPSGNNQSWEATDADLSSAVVISLAASSKTARSFSYQLSQARPVGSGPLGLLAVSSSAARSISIHDSLQSKSVRYEELDKPGIVSAWVRSLGPSRIVVVDFGGRGNAVGKIREILSNEFAGKRVDIIRVGSEANFHAPEELHVFRQRSIQLKMTMFNCSAARDAVMEKIGEENYYREMLKDWHAWLSQDLQRIKLELGHGIRGESGVEGSWKKLCEGLADVNAGMAFTL